MGNKTDIQYLAPVDIELRQQNKYCRFKKMGIDYIDYKDSEFLMRFLNAQGKITNEENWGLKKLKYPIQKKKTGFYCLIEFQADGQMINNFEVEIKREDRVIRWQTVKLENFALAYADRRKKKLSTNAIAE
jgi:ribosomal protein S6